MTTATVPARGLVGYDQSLDAEILRFNLDGWPKRRTDWVEARWRWMFLDSAARLGVAPMVWMYRSADGIVAQQGAIAVRLWVNRHELTTGWFVETMALPRIRQKAIGPMVIKKALEDLPLNLSLGQTADMRALQFAMGWVEVAPLKEYVKVLDARAVVRGKVPALVEPAVGLALSAALWAGRRRAPRMSAEWSVRSVDRFGAEADALWTSVAPHFTCAVVRDASYLNWKFADQPGQAFSRLELRRGNQLAGVVVLTTRDESAYAYRRGMLVDLVVDPTDIEAVNAILDAACRTLSERGAALVRCDLLNPQLEERLSSCGFAARGATRRFLVSTATSSSAVAQSMRDPRSWLVTGGDSDIDRPW